MAQGICGIGQGRGQFGLFGMPEHKARLDVGQPGDEGAQIGQTAKQFLAGIGLAVHLMQGKGQNLIKPRDVAEARQILLDAPQLPDHFGQGARRGLHRRQDGRHGGRILPGRRHSQSGQSRPLPDQGRFRSELQVSHVRVGRQQGIATLHPRAQHLAVGQGILYRALQRIPVDQRNPSPFVEDSNQGSGQRMLAQLNPPKTRAEHPEAGMGACRFSPQSRGNPART